MSLLVTVYLDLVFLFVLIWRESSLFHLAEVFDQSIFNVVNDGVGFMSSFHFCSVSCLSSFISLLFSFALTNIF